MKVLRARVYGYCMGVRRAVDMAYAEAARTGRGRVLTAGPLIHNPQALEELRKSGVEVLKDKPSFEAVAADLADATVVVRAHGIPPETQRGLEARGARIIDATCPRVRSSQTKARALTDRGYRLFLAGERQHGEIVGIQGYAEGCIVVSGSGEATAAAAALKKAEPDAMTALIGQTTLSLEEFDAVANAIRAFFPDLEVHDTICRATKERQGALRELLPEVDATVVVGGKNSSNTRRLFEIALASGKPAWHVETEAELPDEVRSYAVVALTAGASTPDDVVDRVEAHLSSLNSFSR